MPNSAPALLSSLTLEGRPSMLPTVYNPLWKSSTVCSTVLLSPHVVRSNLLDAVVKPKAGKGQRSTAPRGSRGGSAKAKASIRSKPRPRKRHKVRSEVTDQLLLLMKRHDSVSWLPSHKCCVLMYSQGADICC